MGKVLTYPVAFLIVGFLGALLFNPSLIKANKMSEKISEKMPEIQEINKVPATTDAERKEKFNKIREFQKKEKLNYLSPFTLFFLIPFFIWRIQGTASYSISWANVNGLSTKFLWFDLSSYDPYLVFPILFLLLMIFNSIWGSLKGLGNIELENLDTPEKENDQKHFKKHMSRFKIYVYMVIFSITIINPIIAFFIIINMLSMVFISKIIGKDEEEAEIV
jgi:membrane protein insertase Oxa1/YidC/SpoIIIJ